MSGVPILSKVRQLFPRPFFWDYAVGMVVILAYMAHFLIGQLDLEIIKPYRIILYGMLAPFALASFK